MSTADKVELIFSLRYNVLNSISIQKDGVIVNRIDDPDVNAPGYWVSEFGDPVNGTYTIGVYLHLTGPESHGQMSTIRITETSSDPQYRGTIQETASTDLVLTFITPGRCFIQDFSVTPTLMKGGNNALNWKVLSCKQVKLFNQFSPSGPGVVVGNGQVVLAPLFEPPAAPGYEADFDGPHTVQELNAGIDLFTLQVTDILGTTRIAHAQSVISAPAAAAGTGVTPTPACTASITTLCVSQPGLTADSPPDEFVFQVPACSEAEAKTSVQQLYPGASVEVGGYKSFDVCVTCMDGSKTQSRGISACTEAGAKANALRVSSSGCTAAIGSCPQ